MAVSIINRTNAFEVVGVNSASTGVVVCEDSRSLADWIRAITNNISALLSHMVSEMWNTNSDCISAITNIINLQSMK